MPPSAVRPPVDLDPPARPGRITCPAGVGTALLLAAAVAGCASGAGSDVPVGASRDRTVRATSPGVAVDVRSITSEQAVDGLLLDAPADAWARLPGVFERLGIEVTYSDPAARVMGNRGFRVRRIDGQRPAAWVDCGMGPTARPYANEYEVTMGLTVQLFAVERGTRVEVRMEAAAKPRDVSAASLSCTSEGTLERRILSLLTPV